MVDGWLVFALCCWLSLTLFCGRLLLFAVVFLQSYVLRTCVQGLREVSTLDDDFGRNKVEQVHLFLGSKRPFYRNLEPWRTMLPTGPRDVA